MRGGKLFPFVCVFTGIFGVRKVQCYLSVQVSILKFILVLKITYPERHLHHLLILPGLIYCFVNSFTNT